MTALNALTLARSEVAALLAERDRLREERDRLAAEVERLRSECEWVPGLESSRQYLARLRADAAMAGRRGA